MRSRTHEARESRSFSFALPEPEPPGEESVLSERTKVGPYIRKKRYVHEYPGMLPEVRVDEIERPDGSPGTYVTARVKNGALVLAVDDDGMCYLTRQFRYAIERETEEVAAGGADGDEEPLDAAKRELREEL